MLFISLGIVAGLIIGLLDVMVFKRGKKPINKIFAVIGDVLASNIVSVYVMDLIHRVFLDCSVFKLAPITKALSFGYMGLTAGIGFLWILTVALLDGRMFCKKETVKFKKTLTFTSVLSVVLVALGMAAFTGTNWSKETFGDVDPDQMIVNIFSPADGTSSEIMGTLWKGPVLQTVAVTFLFALFVFSSRALYMQSKVKENGRRIFSVAFRKIIAFILAIAFIAGGIAYGIREFQLVTLYDMYYSESEFIAANFANPREVKMKFPKEKRNLIHIYLESMENTYLSKDLGGYMDENLIKPLSDLAEEGVTFSHLEEGFGGPVATMGCTWSVASMVNMTTGLPMKVPTGGNDYGSPNNFLPGAVTLGDILKAQGYEQTLMFGATAKFGGLNYFYESHGGFNMLDYDGVKEKGWIPKDYKVWWGYEDDKLYEFAKRELTRLGETGKPFHFVMETADTHCQDGYVSPKTPTPRDSQYANVIAYSADEVTKFVRWIQDQPFYENTTIVLIGDHLSMDKKFFADMDKSYHRTTFNLILNPANNLQYIPEERRFNRWWYNGDMFPTILASMGVIIEGDRLGLGTNLFSGTPTIMEENGEGRKGWDFINEAFSCKSDMYNETILVGNNEPFDNKNVTEY